MKTGVNFIMLQDILRGRLQKTVGNEILFSNSISKIFAVTIIGTIAWQGLYIFLLVRVVLSSAFFLPLVFSFHSQN